MQNLDNQSDLFAARRRQLLRMGAAGLPMVLTLRASAQEAIISQLRCLFVVPRGTKILVADDGSAWMGTRRLRHQNGKPRISDIENFKANADFVFPAGSAPAVYRPEACAPDPCEGSWLSNLDNADVDSMFAHLTDSESDYLAAEGFSGAGSKGKGHSNHIHCDQHGQLVNGHHHNVGGGGNTTFAECGYKRYGFSNNSIRPGDFVQNNNWQFNGHKKGLYISLAIRYADVHGQQGNWPGISCIVSVLNYLNGL